MRPALDPTGHRVPRTKPTCLFHTWRPHRWRPFALVLHLHQHESSRNLHLQYLAKNQSTQRCQSLITQGTTIHRSSNHTWSSTAHGCAGARTRRHTGAFILERAGKGGRKDLASKHIEVGRGSSQVWERARPTSVRRGWSGHPGASMRGNLCMRFLGAHSWPGLGHRGWDGCRVAGHARRSGGRRAAWARDATKPTSFSLVWPPISPDFWTEVHQRTYTKVVDLLTLYNFYKGRQVFTSTVWAGTTGKVHVFQGANE
jgi:hypothetical protein